MITLKDSSALKLLRERMHGLARHEAVWRCRIYTYNYIEDRVFRLRRQLRDHLIVHLEKAALS